MLPTVAIVGRPNVGKSTLFNKLVGYRMAIEENTPGVTRDRIYAIVEWTGVHFNLVDTGGIQTDQRDDLAKQVVKQAELAIEEADVILLVVDGREGLTPTDKEIAERLRRAQKPVIVVVNKIDSVKMEDRKYEFYGLGFEQVSAISAGNSMGLGDLLDEVIAAIPEKQKETELDDLIKVAIVGKPNVGKSSLVNRILGQERAIVSDIPGTTRDAIDSLYKFHGETYLIIDTAGLRRKSRIKEDVEWYSTVRTLKSVDRSDIVLILIDATEGVTEQDKRIAGYVHEQGKASVIVVNKWDLVEKNERTMDQQRQIIYSELPFLQYAPIIFISAKTGQRVYKLLELIKYVTEQYSLRISTAMLNTLLEEATLMTPPPAKRGKRLRIYYGTQVGVKPPRFVLFVNDRNLMHFSYERFIENTLRESFGFEGSPIQLIIRERK